MDINTPILVHDKKEDFKKRLKHYSIAQVNFQTGLGRSSPGLCGENLLQMVPPTEGPTRTSPRKDHLGLITT